MMRSLVLFLTIMLVIARPSHAFNDVQEYPLIQNAATATGSGTTIPVMAFTTVSFDVAISNTATVTFEGHAGTAAGPISLVCVSAADTAQTKVSTATTSGVYVCPVVGMQGARARISSYTSGTVTVNARASTGVSSVGGGGGGSNASVGTVGSTAPTSATEICGTDGTNCTVPKVITTAPGSTDPGMVTRNINPNLAADNSANSTNKVPILPCRANAAAPTWTEGNQAPCSADLAGNIRFIQPSNTRGGSGVASPSAADVYNYNYCYNGTNWDPCRASGVVDAANNAAAPANVEVVGLEVNSSTQPTAATAGNVRRAVAGLDGVAYVRPGGPVLFACSATGIAATLTQLTNCGAPGAGLSYYITSIVAGSTTATAGNFLLRYGTSANCGTGTTSIYPQAETTAVGFLPANTATPFTLMYPTPIKVPANNLICVLGVATNTTRIDVAGFIAP